MNIVRSINQYLSSPFYSLAYIYCKPSIYYLGNVFWFVSFPVSLVHFETWNRFQEVLYESCDLVLFWISILSTLRNCLVYYYLLLFLPLDGIRHDELGLFEVVQEEHNSWQAGIRNPLFTRGYKYGVSGGSYANSKERVN